MARRELAQYLVAVAVKPPLWLLTRRDWRGLEHLSGDGGVIVVSNHISYADPLVLAHFIYDAGRWPRYLAKQGVFDVPLLGRALRGLHQIPVQRGSLTAAQSLTAATAALRDGGTVVIYPEGTITKQPQLWPMRGRTGVARLWWETGAAIVPVVTWGPHRLHHPHTGKLRLWPRTPVTVAAGAPVDLTDYRRDQPLPSAAMYEIVERVMLRLRGLLAEVRGESAPPLWSPGGAADGAAGGGEPR